MTYLATRWGIVIEGKVRLGALINVIHGEAHSVKTLTESDLEMMDGDGYHNLWMQTGTLEAARAYEKQCDR